MSSIVKSFHYAWEGIKYSFKTQPNFKIHSLGFLFMNISAYYFRFSQNEYLLCLLVSSFIFTTELLNTAIESTIDLITKERHPLAKIAKDCAAGAVLISALSALIIWSIIVYHKI